MNQLLIESFRHSAWATKQLIAFCRALPEEQLATTAVGVFGPILDTLNHVIGSTAGYLRGLAGTTPAWALAREQSADFDVLDARVDEVLGLWEDFLSEPVDADRMIVLDDGKYEVRASVIVTQALDHASVHREQICSILSVQGMEPPDIQSWSYGEASGRGRERPPS